MLIKKVHFNYAFQQKFQVCNFKFRNLKFKQKISANDVFWTFLSDKFNSNIFCPTIIDIIWQIFIMQLFALSTKFVFLMHMNIDSSSNFIQKEENASMQMIWSRMNLWLKWETFVTLKEVCAFINNVYVILF